MAYTKDNITKENPNVCGFYGIDEHVDNSLYFENGKLTAEAYSYQIDSIGEVELNPEQTREIYETMKAFYEHITIEDCKKN